MIVRPIGAVPTAHLVPLATDPRIAERATTGRPGPRATVPPTGAAPTVRTARLVLPVIAPRIGAGIARTVRRARPVTGLLTEAPGKTAPRGRPERSLRIGAVPTALPVLRVSVPRIAALARIVRPDRLGTGRRIGAVPIDRIVRPVPRETVRATTARTLPNGRAVKKARSP